MSRSHNAGLSKRCNCAERRKIACAHPWQMEFYCQKTAHLSGGRAKHRYSLDAVAEAWHEPAPRTKYDAAALAERVHSAIRSGTFKPPHAPEPTPLPDPTRLTVGDVIDQYLVRHVQIPTRRVSSQQAMQWALNVLRRTLIPGAQGTLLPFEMKPIKEIVRADIEAVRTARRATQAGTATRQRGEVGCNRLLERCRHLFTWAVIEGYIEATPFQRGGIAIVKLSKETPRDRRLVGDGEEQRLLHAAGSHLRDLMLAALATGARLSELLSLQWRNIRQGPTRQTVIFEAEKTKTSTRREIPVGGRLAAVLALRRHAPDGVPFGQEAYVFGNEVGDRIQSIKKAWMTCVLKAHGHTPMWVKGTTNQLTPESRATYRAIDLHFHDLRREAGSRLLESGATLAEVRDFLGHTNIGQTSTYLASSLKGLETAVDRKEAYEQRLDDARRAAERPATLPREKVEIASPLTQPVIGLGPDRIQ